MTKAFIKRDYAFNDYDIILLTDDHRNIWRPEDGHWKTEPLNLAEVTTKIIEPTMRMPQEILEALVQAAIHLLPPDLSMASHLKDAMNVRDELLGILKHRLGMK